MDLSIESSENWGEDIWVEVLKRLPIDSVCRFQCVCKSWKSLLSSSWFINLHHSFNSSATPANQKPYLRVINFSDPRPDDSYALCQDSVDEHILHFPFRFFQPHNRSITRLNFHFVGVIRGVVCVSYPTARYTNFDSIILWNPTIHKYVTLPSLPIPLHIKTAASDFGELEELDQKCHSIGFGYDTATNDFKVVRIWIPDYDICNIPPDQEPTYELYSAREGIWRMGVIDVDIEFCQLDLMSRFWQTSCFVKGTIHWLLSDGLVLMFDCEREEFKTMEFPREIFYSSHDVRDAGLLEYAGMLCALSDSYDYCELWVMEEHGVVNSWKKVCRIPNLEELELEDIDIYQPAFMRLAPYGPTQWIKIHPYDRLLSCRVYEESLFLMDDTKAQSYTKDEMAEKYIPRAVPNDFSPWPPINF